MVYFILTTLFFIAVMTVYSIFAKSVNNNKKMKDSLFYTLLIAITALFIKYTGAIFYYERGDMGAFITWMKNLNANGCAGFYTKYGLCYPPLHIFLVYFAGIISKFFNLADFSLVQILLIKSPALICDVLTCIFMYKIGKQHLSDKAGVILCLLYALNPAVFFNSGVWGQMDSIYTLCIIIMCYMISEEKLMIAYFAFAAAILFKYQGIIFAPVIICGILDQVILKDFNLKKFFKHFFVGLSAILTMIICHLPFIFGNGNAANNAGTITASYGEALTAFRYASVNAYNFWAMLGLNWHTQEDRFLTLTYNNWGTIAILIIVVIAICTSFKNKKSRTKYYSVAAFIISAMFLFSVRMHERYLFPAIPLILIAYIVKPSILLLISYSGLTLMNFYNCAHVLFYYNPHAYNPKAFPIISISLGTIIFWALFCFDFIKTNYFSKKPDLPVY